MCRSRLLVENRLIHEAMALNRPLFEESIALVELASVPDTKRVELIVGWGLKSLADYEGILHDVTVDADAKAQALASASESRDRHMAYAQSFGVSPRQSSPNIKNLVAKHSDGVGYIDYRLSHHFVHSSLTITQARRASEGGVEVVGAPGTGDEWTTGLVLSACDSMLHACRAICVILGWDEPGDLASRFAELETFAARTPPRL